MKRFSVVIPTLNSPIIDRTLESLESQTFPRDEFEVIVVGVDKFGLIKTNDLIRFERSNEPLSPATARNRGAKNARGNILVFIDADCIAHPEWLASFDQQFHDSDTSVVGGGIDISSRSYWTLADNLATFHNYLFTHAAGRRDQLPSLWRGVHEGRPVTPELFGLRGVLYDRALARAFATGRQRPTHYHAATAKRREW